MRRSARVSGAGVVVEARAKLNLGLAVGPKRVDGYHELATVFQSISLADTLEARPSRGGFSLVVRHEEAAVRGKTARSLEARVTSGPGNLVLRAARALAARVGLDRGARFTLIKRIPVRSGLGGGSADAGAALVALCALYRIRLTPAERAGIAVELGSDVPFTLMGGTAFALGRGERLLRVRLARPFRTVIAVPAWGVSTASAYARIDRRKYFLTPWRTKLRSFELLGRKQLRAGALIGLGNTFEEVLGRRHEDFISLCARLREAGAADVRMTGSGSAVFGVLGSRVPGPRAVGRFDGDETLYLARSERKSLRLKSLP